MPHGALCKAITGEKAVSINAMRSYEEKCRCIETNNLTRFVFWDENSTVGKTKCFYDPQYVERMKKYPLAYEHQRMWFIKG